LSIAPGRFFSREGRCIPMRTDRAEDPTQIEWSGAGVPLDSSAQKYYIVCTVKKTLSFLLIAALLLPLSARALTYDGALKAAKTQNKPVLLYFFSDSCRYCTIMDRETLADKEIAAMLNKDFVFLRIDTGRSADISALYRVYGTPSSWFLESSGKRIFQAPGYMPKRDFKTVLNYVKGKHYKQMDIEEYFEKASPGK
jgi:thioredoxin-related protein